MGLRRGGGALVLSATTGQCWATKKLIQCSGAARTPAYVKEHYQEMDKLPFDGTVFLLGRGANRPHAGKPWHNLSWGCWSHRYFTRAAPSTCRAKSKVLSLFSCVQTLSVCPLTTYIALTRSPRAVREQKLIPRQPRSAEYPRTTTHANLHHSV